LLDYGATMDLEDNNGWNALDIAIIRMNYNIALVLKKRGMTPRDKEMYESNLFQKYDVDMFLQYLTEERLEVDPDRFFDAIKREREEWLNKDLVVDTRETWKKWAWR